MPYVNIYKGGRQIKIKEFSKQFLISGHKVLFWRADEDEDWTTDKENSEILDILKDAQRHITLINTLKGYELSPVLPNWRLWVDQEECERGFYAEIMIVWNEVKLFYRDYEFVFQFGPKETQVEENVRDTSLPKPLLNETQIDWDYWTHL